MAFPQSKWLTKISYRLAGRKILSRVPPVAHGPQQSKIPALQHTCEDSLFWVPAIQKPPSNFGSRLLTDIRIICLGNGKYEFPGFSPGVNCQLVAQVKPKTSCMMFLVWLQGMIIICFSQAQCRTQNSKARFLSILWQMPWRVTRRGKWFNGEFCIVTIMPRTLASLVIFVCQRTPRWIIPSRI